MSEKSILEMVGGEKHINPHYIIKAEKMTKDEMLKKMESILNDNAEQIERLSKEVDDLENMKATLESRVAELEKENAELRAIAENQQSSNMERYFKKKC